jgi:two-component system OmpR family response regulator
MKNFRVALVEDDQALTDGLSRLLKGAQFRVESFSSGGAADEALQREHFDLLLLDIGLPDLNGLDVLSRLRSRGSAMPVLLLTARDEVSDRVRGLDVGADDYLVKPFAIPELLARIRALLRRNHNLAGRLVHGPLVMDLNAQRAWVGDVPLELSAREWAVLEQLLKNVDKVVSKQHIVELLTKSDATLSFNAVEVYISRVRAKLEQAGVNIRTVRGFGYMLQSTIAA